MIKLLILLNLFFSILTVSANEISFAQKVDDPNYSGEKYILNKGLNGAEVFEHEKKVASEPVIVDETFEYNVGTYELGSEPKFDEAGTIKKVKTTRVRARACSSAIDDGDYVLHSRLASESLMIKLYTACRQRGFDGVRFDDSTSPGHKVIYNSDEGKGDTGFYKKTLGGKLVLVMLCYAGDAVCIRDANRVDSKKLEEVDADLAKCEEDLAAKAGLNIQDNRGGANTSAEEIASGGGGSAGASTIKSE